MNVKIENISNEQRKIMVEIPKEKVRSEFKTVLDELRKMVNVNGFRPGRVPDGILKMRFGKSIRSEVGSKLIESSLEEILKNNEMKVIGKPDLKEWEVDENKDFHFEVILNVIPDFDVEDYREIQLEKQKIEVTDDEIEEGLKRIQSSEVTFVVSGNKNVEKGNRVTARIKFVLDGKAVPGWANRKVDIVVGDNRFFPDSGIEEKLVGSEKNKVLAFNIQFPENYSYYKDFAGKMIHCEVEVLEIKTIKIPDLDDEFAKDLGMESIDDLKEQIKKDLQVSKERELEATLKEKMIEHLIDKNDIPAPQILVDHEMNYIRSLFRVSEDLKEDDEKGLNNILRQKSIWEVKRRLLLDKIAEKENVEVTEDEFEDAFWQECEAKGVKPDEVRKSWEEKGYLEHIKQELIREKVKEMLWSFVTLIDTPNKEEETNGKNLPDGVTSPAEEE